MDKHREEEGKERRKESEDDKDKTPLDCWSEQRKH